MAEDAPSVGQAVIYIPDNNRDPHLAAGRTANGLHSAQQSPATQWPTRGPSSSFRPVAALTPSPTTNPRP